jgi:single-strand DNA-binding protein
MSDVHEGLNLAVLRGSLSSDPRSTDLPSGGRLVRLEVTTRTAAGTESVPVSWFDPPAAAAALAAGQEVVVTGRVRRRWWGSPTGPRSRTEVVATTVIPASQRARARRALEAASSLLPGS